MELFHLEHFARIVSHSQYAFDIVRAMPTGEDPPDFEIKRGADILGIELTVYSPLESQLRSQIDRFCKHIESRFLAEQEKGRLKGLCGVVVEFSFGEEGQRPEPIDKDALRQLVSGIEEIPNKPWEKLDLTKMTALPYPLSAAGEVTTQDKKRTVTWCVTEAPPHPLGESEGPPFEIAWKYRPWENFSDFELRLEKLVREKMRSSQGCTRNFAKDLSPMITSCLYPRGLQTALGGNFLTKVRESTR